MTPPERHRITEASKEVAETLLAEKIRERQQPGLLTGDRDITLGEYKDRWIETVASEIKPRTLKGYKQLLKLHIVPTFGRARLRELSRGMIKAFLAKKRAVGLGKNSVRLIRATLSVVLSDAAYDGILLANPALNLGRRGRSRPDKLSASDRTASIRPMSQEQLGAFLAAARRDTPVYAPLFLLLAHTGMRPGEAFALQWTDVDFASGRIRVEAGAGRRPDRDDEDRRDSDRGHERNPGPRPPAAPARAQAAEARARLGGDAGLGLLHGGRDNTRRKPREEKLL